MSHNATFTRPGYLTLDAAQEIAAAIRDAGATPDISRHENAERDVDGKYTGRISLDYSIVARLSDSRTGNAVCVYIQSVEAVPGAVAELKKDLKAKAATTRKRNQAWRALDRE